MESWWRINLPICILKLGVVALTPVLIFLQRETELKVRMVLVWLCLSSIPEGAIPKYQCPEFLAS